MIKIKSIRYIETFENFNDVIIQLDWKYNLQGFQSIGGTLQMPLPSSDTFIPIENIEQSVMVNWVKTLVNPEAMELQTIKEESIINTIVYE